MDQELGFLGASPDGIVRGKTDVGLLEIKCPLSSDSVSELAAGRGFCLKATAKGLQLKRPRAYYSQVQMQLTVTQMKWADFVVFTSNGSSSSMHVERVHYDDGFWQQALEGDYLLQEICCPGTCDKTGSTKSEACASLNF